MALLRLALKGLGHEMKVFTEPGPDIKEGEKAIAYSKKSSQCEVRTSLPQNSGVQGGRREEEGSTPPSDTSSCACVHGGRRPGSMHCVSSAQELGPLRLKTMSHSKKQSGR